MLRSNSGNRNRMVKNVKTNNLNGTMKFEGFGANYE